MAEMIEERQSLESTTVGIFRTATVVKGGRRFSFAALVVVGDRRGNIGLGYGKAPGVPAAIEKAQKEARKNMVHLELKESTIPHPITGKFCSSKVRLLPAAPGTGVIAGGTVRAVLEMAGVQDCLTKAYGSTNQKNLCKAVIDGLGKLRLRPDIARLRGVEITKSTVDELLEVGRRYMPKKAAATEKAAAPVNLVGKDKGGRKGGPRRGGGRRRGEGQGEEPVASAETQSTEPGSVTPETGLAESGSDKG
ncbi:MAG: 30S ribosomal protein S5 [Phycisphaeraceae bacterium]|nr:30S ribosomal protein S5 [Phycisphaeraceae bacterium]